MPVLVLAPRPDLTGNEYGNEDGAWGPVLRPSGYSVAGP
jgi:hypothetical protein